MPSIVLVAGDPSGDVHAARLVTALKARQPAWTFTGLGGPHMASAGVSLLEDLTKTAAIGPFDAARHVGRLRHATQRLKDHLTSQRPDLAVLVDFGDFNLPVIAPLLKRHHIPIAYYVSPQLWAWGAWRLRYVKRYVDHMIVLLPFEEAFYQRAGVPVTWVGHPLIASSTPSPNTAEAIKRFGLNPWRVTVGLLPGSREDEIRRHLPLLLRSAQRIAWRMPGVQFLLPRAPNISPETLRTLVAQAALPVHIAEGETTEALACMAGAIVTSGTATLETAIAGVPMVVVYRTSWPTYLAARAVLRIPHIALVNVVAGRAVVPEFVQHRAHPRRVANALVALLQDDARRQQTCGRLREVTERLGPPGAVDRAATTIQGLLPSA